MEGGTELAGRDTGTARSNATQRPAWPGEVIALPSQADVDESSWRASLPGFLALAVALAPVLSAIWLLPWFVTQDGPAHVYNAQILADSFDPRSPSRAIYTISWKPIPNWMGHIVLAGLVSWLPAWVADRIMTSATLVGLAFATLWLRWRVAGGKGLVSAALLSALLAMNFAWLMGFTSFVLGSCLFPITLGIWWAGRYRLSNSRIASLAALLCLGYFCHLVSLGLTVVGLVGAVGSRPGPAWQRTVLEVSYDAACPHVGELRSALGTGGFLSSSGPTERTDAAGLGEPVESLVALRVGGPAGLGRPDHARDQGRAAVHELGQPWLRCVCPGSLAGAFHGALVVRANFKRAASSRTDRGR